MTLLLWILLIRLLKQVITINVNKSRWFVVIIIIVSCLLFLLSLQCAAILVLDSDFSPNHVAGNAVAATPTTSIIVVVIIVCVAISSSAATKMMAFIRAKFTQSSRYRGVIKYNRELFAEIPDNFIVMMMTTTKSPISIAAVHNIFNTVILTSITETVGVVVVVIIA